MPLENLEEQGLARNPNLEFAQWRFMLTMNDHRGEAAIKEKLLEAIKADSK